MNGSETWKVKSFVSATTFFKFVQQIAIYVIRIKKAKCFIWLGRCLLNGDCRIFLTVMPGDIFRNPIKSGGTFLQK